MTSDEPGPPDDYPAADGKPKPRVDGPTVMGPTVGHLHGPTPGTPAEPPAAPPTDASPAANPDQGNSSLDEPTVAGPALGGEAFAQSPPDEPTIADARSGGPSFAPPPSEEPTIGPGQPQAEPTIATPAGATNDASPASEESTVTGLSLGSPYPAEPVGGPGPTDEATIAIPGMFSQPADETTIVNVPGDSAAPSVDDATVRVDGPTMAIAAEDVTTTGPTVGGWPFDEPEPPPLPTDLIWRSDPPPSPSEQREPRRSPAYYIGLGAAVVIVVGLVALAAVVSVVKPTELIAGSAQPTQGIPEITTTTTNPPPTTTTAAPEGPLTEVAKHPLSTWQGRMADATCELPRFDPADDRQAAFYNAAKTCADNAWRGLLEETRLEGDVKVVTVTSKVQTTSCGEVDPTSPATQCDGTVYMTPAHLRDTEQNGRYPGRYLGVFLREYARALQFTTGLSELAGKVTTGSAEDLDKRLAQQATCLAGVASGAMSGRGAIDGNITGEISARLSTVDAPPDAKAWLDKGFQARQPSACNTWAS